MSEVLHHAFLDESGGVSVAVPGERFLIIAVLVTGQPRSLELVIKRAFKRYGGSPTSGEMKAAHSADKTVRWILAAIARQDAEIVAVVVDKRGIKPPKDPEDLYRWAAARAIRLCVERWPWLEVTVDRRYMHEHLRRKLEWHIREEIATMEKQAVVIRQVDSAGVKSLQAVDYVAWALWRKYQWKDDSHYRIIADRIIVEELIKAK